MEPASASSPAVELAQKSDPGRDPAKQINEDSIGYLATRFGHLCVVCDGMGGHEGGREASSLALATIVERVNAAPERTPPGEVLREAVAEANRRVCSMSLSAPGDGTSAPRRGQHPAARPGSTVVAILMHAHGTEIAHVGDSRCYLVHQGQIFQVTKDHSMVQQLVDVGLLTPAQAAVHPQANQITRALGMSDEAEVELRAQAIAHVSGDAFVLCSDGLSDLVEPPEILQIVGSAPAAQAVGQLVDLANARGGHDNISVMILRARETANAGTTRVLPTLGETMDEELPSQQITLPGVDRSAPRLPAQTKSEDGTDGAPVTARVPPMAAGGVAPGTVNWERTAPDPPTTAPKARGFFAPRPGRILREGRGGGRSALTVFGIILAVLGLGLAIGAIYIHLSERGGKRLPTVPTSAPPSATSSATPSFPAPSAPPAATIE